MKSLFLISILLACANSFATEWVNETPNTSVVISKQVTDHRHWFVRLDTLTSPMPGNLIGGGLVVGHHFEVLTLDLSAKFLTGTYGAFSPERGLDNLDEATSFGVASDPGAEINNRNRLLTTPFSGLVFGPAVGAHTKMLQKFSPRLSEMARAGFLYGSLLDSTNTTAFTTILIFAEASIHYALSDTGAWTIAGTISANSGRGMNDTATTGTRGRIPLLFGNVGISLAHWF